MTTAGTRVTALFTLGYEGLSLADLLAALSRAGIETLVDVREAPVSRKPGFSKRALEGAVTARGIGYLHRRALGTPKAGRDAARRGDLAVFRRIFDAQLASPAAQGALDDVAATATRARVCLLCYERDPACCHRTIVADALAERTGLTITHLDAVAEGFA